MSDYEERSAGSKSSKKSKSKVVSPATPKKPAANINLVEDELPDQIIFPDKKAPWHNPLNRWTNKPKWEAKEIEAQIILKIPPKTDCWRKTRHNFIMDNAPYNWHKVTGDFEVMVKISGNFSNMYDKAGLMIRVDPENWLLSGLEYFNDRVHHSTSVTVDYTEWSLSQLPVGAEEVGVWFCVKRLGNTYECFYSFDCRTWVQTRQGIFTDRPTLQVGICGACPLGNELEVCFDGYRVDPL